METRNAAIPSLSENITRRRFIKRTGAATVATILAIESFNQLAFAQGGSCACVSISIPAGKAVDVNVNQTTTVAQIQSQVGSNGSTSAVNCPPSWPSGQNSSMSNSSSGGGVSENANNPPGPWQTPTPIPPNYDGRTTFTIVGPASLTLCGVNW